MAYINMVDINGKTYNLENLTDGEFEVFLPVLNANDEFILKSGVVNNLTSYETKKPLSGYQGRVLSTQITDLTTDMNTKFEDLETYVNEQDTLWSDSIKDETTRATEAEKVLTDNLAQEVTDRTNAVMVEQNRATAKENEISDDLTAEINRAEAAEKANADAIAALEEKHNTEIATKVDKVDGSRLMTTVEGDKLAGIAENANNYSHPVHTTYTSNLYKITINELGHVTEATVVTKEDIIGLGIPAQDTTYSDATTSASGLLSSTDKTTYDGYATLITELQNKINELEERITTLEGGSATE